MKKQSTKKSDPETNRTSKGFWQFVFLLVIICMALWGYNYYRTFFRSNVNTGDNSFAYVFIHTGSDLNAVEKMLADNHLLIDMHSFDLVAHKKKYDNKIRPGRYKILNGMNNNELVNMLRSGKQEPVKMILQNVRNPEELAGKIAAQIEGDSLSLLDLMRDSAYLANFTTTPASVFTLFIPNTYELFWNTSADQFIRRMYKERQKFWNEDRLSLMKQEGLTINGVVTLASIMEKESAKNAEKPAIAGVYLNRLRKGWPLQADPTLIFAWNDYSIKRVLNKHKEIESPYNTYKYTGLPPGPICLPSVSSIEAVLHYDHNNYMYFCAKDDLSGFHNFSVTLAEHNRNAERYQAALKRMHL